MTSYTDNRRYPYPSSEREVGNGAAASEALARAVAADLDALDTAWALEPMKATRITNLSADGFGLGSGTDWLLLMNQTVKSVGDWGGGAGALQINVPGWYYVGLNLHTAATGAVTGNARHIAFLRHNRTQGSGISKVIGERMGDAYTTTGADVHNRISGMFRCVAGDRFLAAFQHTNTASTVKVVAAGTYVWGTRVCGL